MDKSKFGTIVTDNKPTAQDIENQNLERKIREAELSLVNSKLVLTVKDAVFNKLEQAAAFHGYDSVEVYCVEKLLETLESKVGAPSISKPGAVNGTTTVKRITGPSSAYYERRGITPDAN